MADPYIDPRTGVLRNRLGITDAGELQRVEADLVGAAEAVLYRERSVPGRYDLDHLQAVHKHLFGRVYDWAGQLRTVQLAKPDTLFARAEHVEAEGRRLFAELAGKDHLQGLDRRGFTIEAGRLLGDLNALHPFREGNGRSQRGFLQLLAQDAGWQLAWGQVERAENVRRSQLAMVDPDALVPLLDEIVTVLGEPLPPSSLILPPSTDVPPRAMDRPAASGLSQARAAAQLAAQDRTVPVTGAAPPGGAELRRPNNHDRLPARSHRRGGDDTAAREPWAATEVAALYGPG